MNRSRRPKAKPFVSGGVYDPNVPVQQSEQQKVQQQPENPIVDEDDEYNNGTNGVGQKPQFRKIFTNRKKPSVRAKEKRIRRNRQLRKAILPKNALMALHEVKGITIGEYVCNNCEGGGGFNATVTVNGVEYSGRGASKTAAKNNVSEKALRDYIINKMIKKSRFQKSQQSLDSSGKGEAMDVESEDGDEGEDEDLPMVNLASFAIYKLFLEWEQEGFTIPELHPARPTSNASENGDEPIEPKKAPIRHELPANWATQHPATLLCLMRPGVNYVALEPIGEKPNIIQRLSITLDEKEFIGSSRSKKVARRNAAVEACNSLFGTNFVKEE